MYAQQPDNIQPADVILKVLNDHENILVTKWDDNSPIPTDRLLVASGKHWTAVLKDRQDWSKYHHRSRFPIHSITDFLGHRIKQGTVYTVDHWSIEDKKSRTREDEVAADGNNIFVPLRAQFNTPQREAKCRKLQAHSSQ